MDFQHILTNYLYSWYRNFCYEKTFCGRNSFALLMGLPGSLRGLLTFWGGILNGKWAFSYKPSEFAYKMDCPVLLQRDRNDPTVTIDETNAIYAHLKGTKTGDLRKQRSRKPVQKRIGKMA